MLIRNSINCISKTFALKINRKQRKCDTIYFTSEFFQNLIKIQKDNIFKLFESANNFNNGISFNIEFLLSTYKINSILKNRKLDELIEKQLTQNILNSGIKTNSSFFNLIHVFFENMKNNPDHPLAKELKTTTDKYSFLFTKEERDEINNLFTKDKTKKGNLVNEYDEAEEGAEEAEEGRDQDLEQDPDQDRDENTHEDQSQLNLEKLPLENSIIKNLTPEENGATFVKNFVKLKMQDENIKLYLDEGRMKVTIKSKHFLSKIKIIGVNDNETESILSVLKYIDKDKPNTILLQKRPVIMEKSRTLFDGEGDNKKQYTSLLKRDEILNYRKTILQNNPKFKINEVEKIVYEELDNFKTISYAQSLILKSSYALNNNPNIKIVLTDIPISLEIENLVNNIINSKINPTDFFNFMKLNLLFEKYLWLIENCGTKCPSCDTRTEFSHAHIPLEILIDDFLLSVSSPENIRIKNISDKIIKSVKLDNYKDNTIIGFIEEKYFYQVIERIVRDVNSLCEEKVMDRIEKILLTSDNLNEEFNFPVGDFNSIIKNYIGDQNEILNKFAMILNIYDENDIFELEEFKNLKGEYQKIIKDLFYLYRDKLNFIDEMNIWRGRKYDYKCYPNNLLINKYIN